MRLSTLVSLLSAAGCSLGSSSWPGDAVEAGGAAPDAPAATLQAAETAPWELQVETARLVVGVTTDGTRGVRATLDGAGGTLRFDNQTTLTGAAGSLTFDLSSWASGVAPCDQQVKDQLFAVSEHPTATFSLRSLEGLPQGGGPAGRQSEATAIGTVYLAGGSARLSVPLEVTRGDLDTLALRSAEPALVSIEELGLADGLQAVMRACGHTSIADEVTLSVTVALRGADVADPGPPAGDPQEGVPEAVATPAHAEATSRQANQRPLSARVPARTLESLRAKRKLGKLGKLGKRKLGKSKSKSKRSP